MSTGGDFLKKVQSGQPLRIPAAAYNEFVDAAVDLRMRRQQGGGGEAAGRRRESGLVLVKNAAGGDLDRFAVVTVSGVAISPTDNLGEFQAGPILTVTAPVDGKPVAILQEPIHAGAYGRAIVFGVTPAKVDIEDTDHEYAKLLAGNTVHMESDVSGQARILCRPTSAGDQWCVVAINHTASMQEFAHPWKVTLTGTGNTTKYSCTNGLPLSHPASPAGRVWTREGNKLDVAEKRDQAVTSDQTVCCKVTVPDSGAITAEIVVASGAVDYWQHSSGSGVVKHYPLALITFDGTVPSVLQIRFSDIDAGAGININDDATSKLWDGTTEFLVLTEQGAAGATAGAKVRKLTVQLDHGQVIRWEWGTPETAIGFTNASVTKYEKVKWDGTAHKLVQETWTERWENGVLLERTAGSDVDIVSFTEYVPCTGE